jgi:hypothetical protein
MGNHFSLPLSPLCEIIFHFAFFLGSEKTNSCDYGSCYFQIFCEDVVVKQFEGAMEFIEMWILYKE